jgi:hypothetical protein
VSYGTGCCSLKRLNLCPVCQEEAEAAEDMWNETQMDFLREQALGIDT